MSEPKELNYNLTSENTELVKGETSQKAVENTSPKESVVNTITVDEVKEMVGEGVEGADDQYVSEKELPGKIEQGIEASLLNGDLKDVLQAKSLSVADFPLTLDIDNQHSTVNEGLLPNGDMEELTETQINKIANTLKRVINKGWLRISTLRSLKLTSIMYNTDVISITASSLVFSGGAIISGISRLITLDIANASYSYSEGTYTPQE